MLIADRTFRVGDLVKIVANEGVFESVALRTTRTRGLEDSLLTMPNSDLTTAHLINFGTRCFRRFWTQLNVPFSTHSDLLAEFRDGFLGLIRQNPATWQEKHEVDLNDLGSSGLTILGQVFFDVSDGHAWLIARDDLILEVLRLANRLGLSFTEVDGIAAK